MSGVEERRPPAVAAVPAIRRRLKRGAIAVLLTLPYGDRLKRRLKRLAVRIRSWLLAHHPLYDARTRYEGYLALARQLSRETLYELAVEQFGKAIALEPTVSEGYVGRGQAHLQWRRLDAAIDDFRCALAADVTCGLDEQKFLHATLARLIAERGDTEDALDHYHACLTLQPEYADPPGGRGHGPGSLRALITAHNLVAEDIINFRGDFEAALEVYRRQQGLQQLFAQTYHPVDERVLYLPDDWVRNIGHMALLDFWVKMQHLGWRSWDRLVLCAPGRPANAAYLRCWERHYDVVSEPERLRSVTPLAEALGRRVACLLELPKGPDRYLCEGMGLIQEEWEAQGRGPLLELPSTEVDQGWATLTWLGVPRDAWFVCLHVRSAGFHKEGESLHQAHRNADVLAYLPAVLRIVESGGWVVRMGDPSMPPLPPMPGVIDYAHSNAKSPEMDLFLCASCRFFVGVASGLSHVPTTFGVPCALTNWVSNALPVASQRDRFIPKLIRTRADHRLLGFRELLSPEIRTLAYSGEKLHEHGLEALDNTPLEIVELIEEMLEITSGSMQDAAADEARQSAFRSIALACGLAGFSRISRAFLRRHADLLPQDDAPTLQKAHHVHACLS
jgi:putative glycosyltransferase (TIGR04372 family)